MAKKNKKKKLQNEDLANNSSLNAAQVGPVKVPDPIPKEELIGVSKQINPSASDKPAPKSAADKALKELVEVSAVNTKLERENLKLSGILVDGLAPSEVTLDNVTVIKNNPDSSIFNLVGKTAKRQNMSEIISSSLEERLRSIVSSMPTGLYGKILQAKYNNYLEENLPVLKQSATIFIDDVCNGSYRGSENGNVKRFRFYREGVEITDEKQIARMEAILNPTEYDRISTNRVPFNDIDWQTDYSSWKDGYSLVRLIPNKKIAKELYLKYVIRNVKLKKTKKNIENDMKERNFTPPGVYDITANTNIKENLDEASLKILSANEAASAMGSFLNSKEVFRKHFDGNLFEYNEFMYHANESIDKFLTRSVESAVYPIYNTARYDINESADILADDNIYKGSYFTYEPYNYTIPTLLEVTEQMRTALSNVQDNGIESFTEAFDSMNLDNMTLNDIYMNRWEYNDDEEDITDNVGMEASGIDLIDNPGSMNSGSFNEATGVRKNVENKIAERSVSSARIEKMFETITGESIEYLDNTRTIPILVGNRLIGAFYIEYTHQDVEHYMGLRQLMNSNMVSSSDTTAFGIRTEEQEETLGRLVFGDIIKPLVEKNMDTKFLKNNPDALKTIQTLLKENEVSETASAATVDRQNGFNMSRIIFIPAEELIFKRNGKTGLGESRFNLALVPANAAILGNESYLAYLLIDSKGMSFISIPQGLSEVQGEEGTNPLMDQFNDMRITRTRLRDLTLNNYDLGHKMIFQQKPDSGQDVSINTIQIPAPELDDNRIQQWIQQATDIVGYNSALFNSVDGSVEFARNLFEMNEMKMLQLLTCRSNKIRPSSELATRLLRLRDPSYEDITVEWVAPPINRSNTQKRSEQAKEIFDLYESYSGVMDNLYADNEDYALVVEEAKKLLLQRIAGDDQIIMDMIDNIIKQAKEKKNVALAAELEEEDGTKGKKQKEESENEDEEEQQEE